MRQTKRKRQVLDMLVQGQPTGVALLNELCCRYLEGEASPGSSGEADRRKSFNRTVLSGFTGLEVHYLADKQYIYEELTAGIFARWAVWELLDQKYLSGFPRPKEMIVAVGRDACAAFSVLKRDQLAVIGPATFMKDIVVLGNRKLDFSDFYKLSEIPWALWCFTEGGVTNDPRFPVAKLARLPYIVELEGKSAVSTARKRLPYR
ncbi:hypothetical protein EN829_021450 [Mesorhizobium sp. M00.F.Ca.ET.186.01.1.1]|nr:hypothetical protein EN848_29640 [bacterium M00.F.Ca.ET.205.01.1.1]TGU50572.1 hypothetical protein EN795_23495 [bacterium M00.F.Ca.ET.152.01.1.1]TGV34032.1 hypothetical protein EN829_021450 [Mesorhizobium sp. M00.F.Ca.ET.186.01.1.1]TGZ40936.1 hypothetical protein EN805_22890 [bacterium M00.F.Ca.ET.162.01.1.1]